MKYEWAVNAVNINKIAEDIDDTFFKAWCFDNNLNSAVVYLHTLSVQDEALLEELHKPERKEWLYYAINNEYVKPVKQTFIIGDVVKITTCLKETQKYIINSAESSFVVLNTKTGTRFDDPIKVKDETAITKEELLSDFYKELITNFEYIGHGIEYLI